MHNSNRLRYYKKQIYKKIKKMSAVKKKLILVGASASLIGVVLGSCLGSSIQKNKSEKQVEKIVAEVKVEEQKKVEKIKQELFQEQEVAEEKKERPWYLSLVNSTHPMEEGYVPELVEVEKGHSVDSRIVEPLNRMLEAAKKDGMHIIICSAYRSVEKQEQVFNTSVQERLDAGMNYWEAYRDTAMNVAYPGTSEHGMGLALDLISNQYTGLDEKQAETEEAEWLEENCYKYGFILRYPPDKTVETGIIYEPWHYRYVGEEDAKKIMESGVTLETYLKENY